MRAEWIGGLVLPGQQPRQPPAGIMRYRHAFVMPALPSMGEVEAQVERKRIGTSALQLSAITPGHAAIALNLSRLRNINSAFLERRCCVLISASSESDATFSRSPTNYFCPRPRPIRPENLALSVKRPMGHSRNIRQSSGEDAKLDSM